MSSEESNVFEKKDDHSEEEQYDNEADKNKEKHQIFKDSLEISPSKINSSSKPNNAKGEIDYTNDEKAPLLPDQVGNVFGGWSMRSENLFDSSFSGIKKLEDFNGSMAGMTNENKKKTNSLNEKNEKRRKHDKNDGDLEDDVKKKKQKVNNNKVDGAKKIWSVAEMATNETETKPKKNSHIPGFPTNFFPFFPPNQFPLSTKNKPQGLNNTTLTVEHPHNLHPAFFFHSKFAMYEKFMEYLHGAQNFNNKLNKDEKNLKLTCDDEPYQEKEVLKSKDYK